MLPMLLIIKSRTKLIKEKFYIYIPQMKNHGYLRLQNQRRPES